MSLNSDSGTVEYTVRVDGDLWDHEQFREMVHENGGEIVAEEQGDA